MNGLGSAGDGGLVLGIDGLRLQPMVHVRDMAAAVDFYQRLGGQLVHGSRDGDWVLLRLGGAELGLLAHPPNSDQGEGAVELNFRYEGSLGELEKRLRAVGAPVAQPATDTGFGRQLQLKSPDGLAAGLITGLVACMPLALWFALPLTA